MCSFVAPKHRAKKQQRDSLLLLLLLFLYDNYSGRCSLISLEERYNDEELHVLDSARERNKTGKFLEKTENPRVKKETERKRKR